MLHVALKEWHVVCDLLLEGQLALLLRKGGISEPGGDGVFELEHGRFALYPSWAHQKPPMIKAAHRSRVQALSEPEEIPLEGWAAAAHIWPVPSRGAFDQLDDLHCWTKPQIDMRFDYKPERPLYLLAVRAHRLASPKHILNMPEYAGCKSWVPLREKDAVDETGSAAAMRDEEFAEVVRRVGAAFG